MFKEANSSFQIVTPVFLFSLLDVAKLVRNMGTSWKKWKSVLDVGARLITLSCFMCIPLQCYLCWGKLLSENTETTIYLKQTSPKLSISLCLVPDFQVFIETPDTIVPLNEADLGVDYINDFSSTWKPFFRTNNSKIKSYLYSKDKIIA